MSKDTVSTLSPPQAQPLLVHRLRLDREHGVIRRSGQRPETFSSSAEDSPADELGRAAWQQPSPRALEQLLRDLAPEDVLQTRFRYDGGG